MKTKHFYCIMLAGLALFSMQAMAGEADAVKYAKDELKEELYTRFQGIPFQDLISDDTYITVVFRVNENAEIGEFHIHGENMSLVSLAEQMLKREKVSVSPLLVGECYKIKITFRQHPFSF